MKRIRFGACFSSTLLAIALGGAADVRAGQVELLRVPAGGLQPQAAFGADGALHLVYFRGEAGGGNIFYSRRSSSAEEFPAPVRVNSTENTVIAAGTIRGAQLSLGRNDRPHVVWMGTIPEGAKDTEARPQHPMYYTRLDAAGTAFEPQRNLLNWTGGLDGGGSVAADARGNVYVAWHGAAPDNTNGEFGRAVFVTRSIDDGETFSREQQAGPDGTGACACCGMRAFSSRPGELRLVYRTANELSRDMVLLTSRDSGRTFSMQLLNRWFTKTCPMSSATIARTSSGLVVATESGGRIRIQFIDDAVEGGPAAMPVDLGGGKHPSVAYGGDEVLVAWAEGAGWQKGGTLRWKRLSLESREVIDSGGGEDVPDWSYPAAAHKDGPRFIIY